MIKFEVIGDPVARPRQRVGVRSGRAFTYTKKDHPINLWKELVFLQAERYKPEIPIKGPIWCDMVFKMKRPKSHFRTGRYRNLLKDSAPIYHIQKPDKDNLEKAILDVLTNLGYWNDDSQVCSGATTKLWANEAVNDIGVFIRIEKL